MPREPSANLNLLVSQRNSFACWVDLNIRASRTSGDVVGTTLLARIIDVPIYRDFDLEASYAQFSDDNGRLFVEGFASVQEKSILMTLNNNEMMKNHTT